MNQSFYLENVFFEKGFFEFGNGIGDLGNRFLKSKLTPAIRNHSISFR